MLYRYVKTLHINIQIDTINTFFIKYEDVGEKQGKSLTLEGHICFRIIHRASPLVSGDVF